METHCPDCGTPNYESARFCRKCGRTLLDYSVTEATTRNLEGGRQAERPYAEYDDRASYIPPREETPPGGLAAQTGFQYPAGTNPMPPSKPSNWPIAVAVLVALLMIFSVVATFLIKPSSEGSPAPKADAPVVAGVDDEDIAPPDEIDVDPDVGDVEDEPEVSDDGVPLSQISESARQWIYPGSTADSVHELPGGQVALELHSDADYADVVKFYTKKMPNAIKEMEKSSTNLVGNGAAIEISEEGGTTSINVLVNSGIQVPNMQHGIPGVPVPPPPAPPAPPPPAPSRQ